GRRRSNRPAQPRNRRPRARRAARPEGGWLAALQLPGQQPHRRRVAGPAGDDPALLRLDSRRGRARGAHPPHRAAAVDGVDRRELAVLVVAGAGEPPGAAAGRQPPRGDGIRAGRRRAVRGPRPWRRRGDGARHRSGGGDLRRPRERLLRPLDAGGAGQPPPRRHGRVRDGARRLPHDRRRHPPRPAHHRVGGAPVDRRRVRAPRHRRGRRLHRGRQRQRRQPALRPVGRQALADRARRPGADRPVRQGRRRRGHLRGPDVDGLRGRAGSRAHRRDLCRRPRRAAGRHRPGPPPVGRGRARRRLRGRRRLAQRHHGAWLGRRVHPPHRALHRPAAPWLGAQHRQPGVARHPPADHGHRLLRRAGDLSSGRCRLPFGGGRVHGAGRARGDHARAADGGVRPAFGPALRL
ncbi:MAG: Aminopeptidase YpdF (MP-, MA-, MS-, AP-, NP-specific), partial [uncultured Gemmatimonadetes bacterium]